MAAKIKAKNAQKEKKQKKQGSMRAQSRYAKRQSEVALIAAVGRAKTDGTRALRSLDLARFYHRTERFKQAAKEYKKAIEYGLLPRIDAEAWLDLAVVLYGARILNQAQEHMVTAIARAEPYPMLRSRAERVKVQIERKLKRHRHVLKQVDIFS